MLRDSRRSIQSLKIPIERILYARDKHLSKVLTTVTENVLNEINEAMWEFNHDSADVEYNGGMILEDRNQIEKREFMDVTVVEGYR